MPLPVAVYLFPFFFLLFLNYIFDCCTPFPFSFILFRCVAHSLSLFLLCLPIWAVLHYLYMYMVAFLALRILYVVALICFVFCSLVFPLLNPFLAMMSSAGYFHALFLLSAFFLSFPTVSVPDLFWCNFLYLVTTAGFVADQLIM